MKLKLSPFEVAVIRRLDREFLIYQNEKNNPKPVSIVQTLKAQQEEQKRLKASKGKPSGR